MNHPVPFDERTIPRLGAGPRLAVLAVLLPLLSCSENVTGPSDVVGNAWRLESMQLAGAAPFTPADADRFTVEFDDDGSVGVVADCNQCGGSYSVSDGTLSVSDLACTLILCPTAEGGQFASLIDGTSRIEREGENRLVIGSSEGTLVLRR
jgi:heat shock protein HslJ